MGGIVRQNYLLIKDAGLRDNMRLALDNYLRVSYLDTEVRRILNMTNWRLNDIRQLGECKHPVYTANQPCKENIDPAPEFTKSVSQVMARVQAIRNQSDSCIRKIDEVLKTSRIIDVKFVDAIQIQVLDILRRVESLPVTIDCNFHFVSIFLGWWDWYNVRTAMCVPCSMYRDKFPECDDNPGNIRATITYPVDLMG